MSLIGKTTNEKKEKLTKAIVNIIGKLKTSTGLKREKYMNMVRTEFNLEKTEKWVLTKLRLMLVRLDVGLELLGIRTSDNNITKKRQFVAKETSQCRFTSKESRVRTMKDTNVAFQTREQSKMGPKSSKAVVETSKQTKTAKRKSRKSLECRQLEKLRTKTFRQEEPFINTNNKVGFLSMMNLCPAVICL